MKQVLAYNPTLNPIQLTTHFVDGLKPDVRAVAMLQRPPDLDTACALATMQEEVAGMESVCSHEFLRPEQGASVRQPARGIGSLCLHPPPRLVAPATIGDHCGIEGPRASNSDKVGALRAYMRARGPCFVCSER